MTPLEYALKKVPCIEIISYFVDEVKLLENNKTSTLYSGLCPFCKSTKFNFEIYPETNMQSIMCDDCEFEGNILDLVGRIFNNNRPSETYRSLEDTVYFIRTRFKDRFSDETEEEKKRYAFKLSSSKEDDLFKSIAKSIQRACSN